MYHYVLVPHTHTHTPTPQVNNLRLVINLAVGDEDVIGELNDTMLQEVQTKARNLIKE